MCPENFAVYPPAKFYAFPGAVLAGGRTSPPPPPLWLTDTIGLSQLFEKKRSLWRPFLPRPWSVFRVEGFRRSTDPLQGHILASRRFVFPITNRSLVPQGVRGGRKPTYSDLREGVWGRAQRLPPSFPTSFFWRFLPCFIYISCLLLVLSSSKIVVRQWFTTHIYEFYDTNCEFYDTKKGVYCEFYDTI